MATPEQLHESVEGLTIPGLLRRNARRFAARPALTTGPGPDAGTLSWAQLRAEVAALTRGLTVLGLRRGDRMLIAMTRRAEHWVADLAAVHAGALPCSTYDTLSTEQIGAVARTAGPPSSSWRARNRSGAGDRSWTTCRTCGPSSSWTGTPPRPTTRAS